MSFLTPLLLSLAGFAAIPILLHLIRRKRVRILDFPTFRFLKKAAMEQRFHLRLQDQLLMLLRMLILLLLALAFAGPVVQHTLSAETRYLGHENILVVDDSLSMAVVRDGKSLFESAVSTASSLLERQPGMWKVVLASEVMGASDPLKNPVSAAEELQRLLAGQTSPSYRGPMAPVVDKLCSARKPDEPVWLLTDRTSSNWKGWSPLVAKESGGARIEVLQIGEPVTHPNAAIRDLTLLNEPLFENEPALLSVAYEVFGASGPRPLGVQAGWRGRDQAASGSIATFSIPESDAGQGSIESLLESAGQVASVTAQLQFPEGVADPLPQDDFMQIQPKSLSGIKVQLLTSDTEWRNLLQAGLTGFDVEVADSLQPPPPGTTDATLHILMLDSEIPAPEWGEMLRTKVQAGAGLVVFYDQPADGVRLASWLRWWQSWGVTGKADAVPQGDIRFVEGVDPWFACSLDQTSRDPNWAQSGFPLFRIDDWETDLAAQTPSKAEFPLLQTHRVGQGMVVSWTVPLSLQTSSLILSHGWVPLLSQIVKRPLVDPEKTGMGAERPDWVNESALFPLSQEEIDRLEQQGCSFSEAAETIKEIETLPRTQQDWTVVILLLCLGLALLEIGLSNYL